MSKPEIRTVDVTRYVMPLREGGSLPAIVEADDQFKYVIKFRGAGQGTKALIAELIGGELARRLDLKVPELVFLQLDDSFGRTEPDEEIQDLLKFSVGLNLGLHYLSGSITYDPVAATTDALTASKVVLLDSLITNVDRTHRNTNLLNWKKELWLIDHGAALYFHHNWENWEQSAQRTFPAIKNHVLLAQATQLAEAKEIIETHISTELIEGIIESIPEDWLEDAFRPETPAQKREVYQEFLRIRLSKLDSLAKEAEDARKAGI
ncbi:MAG: HipA family kinase [Bacteroidota bacterium]